jgi:hypothetical protein
MPNNFVLNKRPSHNINSSKMMRSFNMYINSNPNQNPNSIQYMKRPSYNIKNNMNMNINTNINNNYNPMKEIIIAGKRPSHSNYFSVSNCLNNTETKKNPSGTTKIKKLTSNNMDPHRALTGKNIEVIRDAREMKSRGLGMGYGQDNFGQNFNKTFENDIPMNNNLMNQYNIKTNSNINNNMIINKGNMINNSGKIIELSDKIQMNQFFNNNQNMNTNFGNNNNNKIRVEKIPSYKTNYPNKIGNYQNPTNQFDNNMQNYGFNIY